MEKILNDLISSIYINIASEAINLRTDSNKNIDNQKLAIQKLLNPNFPKELFNKKYSLDDCLEAINDFDSILIRLGFYEDKNGFLSTYYFSSENLLNFWKKRLIFIRQNLLTLKINPEKHSQLKEIIFAISSEINSLLIEFKHDNIDLLNQILLKDDSTENRIKLEEKVNRSESFLKSYKQNFEEILCNIYGNYNGKNLTNLPDKESLEEYFAKGGNFDLGKDFSDSLTKQEACKFLRRVKESTHHAKGIRGCAAKMAGDMDNFAIKQELDYQANVNRHRKQVIDLVTELILTTH